MKTKEQIINSYAHDYRDMKMTEDELKKVLELFANNIIPKYYVEVIEEPDKFVQWSICLGNPNPDNQHSILVQSKERAFEIKEKLTNYLNEIFLKD